MTPVKPLAPFFFQLSVSPKSSHKDFQSIYAGFATVIVFSHTGEKARALMGRYIAEQKWEIVDVKRIQLLTQENISKMSMELRQVYLDAEQQGIGGLFDIW